MRKLIGIIILIVVLFVTLCACNGVSPSDNYTLTRDMKAEDIFEMIKKADSFSVSVGTNEYRFIKNKGYSIYESKIDVNSSTKSYDGFFVEDSKIYSINNDTANGLEIKYREVQETDYEKIVDTYFEYVEYVRGTYANTQDGAEISVEIEDNEATVKTIYRQGEGLLEIKKCKLYGINSTELFIPKAYAKYKELAEYESL